MPTLVPTACTQFSSFERIVGTDLPETINGTEVNNLIEGRGGGDTLYGGPGGENAASYCSSPGWVNVSLATGNGLRSDAEGDTLKNFRDLLGSAYDDILTGDNNNNTIYGIGGDDLIEGKAGPDKLYGGDGIDTLSYASSASGVAINLAVGRGTAGDAMGDEVYNFENIVGSNFDDYLIGNANANYIQGNVGDDEIEGKEGNDIIEGNEGDDIIEGGAGGDALFGGAGIDTLSYVNSREMVTVNLATGAVSGGDATGDTISQFENILGSNFGDTLEGDSHDNDIRGNAGNDALRDGGGNDLLTGGPGRDRFIISKSGTVNITDFISLDDKIDVIALKVRFAQIKNAAVNRGGSCEIILPNKKIILFRIDRANINELWFDGLAQRTGGMPIAEILSLIGSIGSAILTVGGFILKSYHYYRPGIMGHDRLVSFASSLIPKVIKHTTANTVRAAERAIKSVVDLQAQYDAVNSRLINNQLHDALRKAEHLCRVAATEARTIREAASATLATASGKAAAAAQKTLNTAATAFEFYTRHYQEYASAIQQLGVEPENLELKAMNPIGIALSQEKIELVSLNESTVFFDYLGNGTKAKTAWVGSRDAFLIYDHNDNSRVDFSKELVLTEWSKTATTDFMALKEVFDSNKDNKFDANDAEFKRFRIWQDKNQDGISQSKELTTLAKAGLVQIDFDTERAVDGEFFGRQQQMQVAGVLWADGHQTLAYDLALEVSYTS